MQFRFFFGAVQLSKKSACSVAEMPSERGKQSLKLCVCASVIITICPPNLLCSQNPKKRGVVIDI